ncbi:class I SAM-dependent methyltransferase [Aquabacterium sp. OR-4]|uniref:class I SAM-dependent methyltransferase n=1 Tax=Aquabacterium sp. OR-4 TaxID=2978127 RepID=UPI0028C55080|nr:methyltransferase domain-containing protein [Aquabacterium sp. OR-4]MDT7834483.1 methyltransferase domain-containing protein [Aquabacterium sp. OR-4]
MKSLIRPIWHKYRALRRRATFLMATGPSVDFTCNICGSHTSAPLLAVSERETPSCTNCGSTLRFRSIAASLTQELHGAIQPLSMLPLSKSLVGIGMSDATIYADQLSRVYSYRNTFYHQAPRLDVTDVSDWPENGLDFIITSDVLEHISAPVETAFHNMHRLLKSGGLLVLSVPYKIDGDTQEHFPNLHKWSISSEGGVRTLVNECKDGTTERFTDLCFHGGDGATLEMRVFGLPHIISLLETSGFNNIKVHQEDIPEFGVIHAAKDSLVITARS